MISVAVKAPVDVSTTSATLIQTTKPAATDNEVSLQPSTSLSVFKNK